MDKRTTLALLLMAALLMIYPAIFLREPAPEQAPDQKTGAPGPGTSAPPAAAPAAPSPVAAPLAPKEAAAVPERTAVVETPLYRASIGSTGGHVKAWDLNFRGEKQLVLPGVVEHVGWVVRRPGQPPRPIAFALSAESLKLDKDAPAGEIRMVGEDGFGLRVSQVLRFRADTYVVEHELRVENRHTVAQGAELAMSWSGPAEWPKEHELFGGARPIHVVRLPQGSFWTHREYLTNAKDYVGEDRWVGFESGVAPVGQNGVYLTGLIPRAPGMAVTESRREVKKEKESTVLHIAEIGIRATVPVLEPGKSWDGRLQSYMGPMEYERLKAVGVGLEKAIYFGGFPFPESWAIRYGLPTFPMEYIVVPTLALMRWFYHYVPNYGVAIILLTVITKVLLFPLTVKSMTSMKAMQALQPQINALRSKHKSDPQRLQRETMELYRAHKVNPLGGCLPMVVQVPIFYALYDALSVSVDLQNAPFICFGKMFGLEFWICDLARHDPTYILPILMGVSMFVQQKMTPVMGDPRQAKMMLFMPVIFTFMFFNLPSGLVLYWTLSNVLQILQQKYMDRMGKAAKVPARATKKA
ncbi:MAG TPA: membrane protein insertase YidC [Methylomirabilota bacterium]|nr:membrane protein insertase YidC [Methylomirabilota bacterium]